MYVCCCIFMHYVQKNLVHEQWNAGILINTLFIHQQWARRNTIFLFHEESNWIFDRFGDVWRYPHFSTPNYKIHEITMDFCHVFSSPISDFTWTAEAAEARVGRYGCPTLPVESADFSMSTHTWGIYKTWTFCSQLEQPLDADPAILCYLLKPEKL